MRTFYRYLALVLVSLLVVFAVGCEHNPVEPVASEDNVTDVKPVPINPEKLGLAKGVMSFARYITVWSGGKLGGPQTDYNYAEIPPFTLQKNMFMYFKLTLVEDTKSDYYGTLMYTIHAWGYDEADLIPFRNESKSWLYINKDWLGAEPNVLVNIDTGEKVRGIEDYGRHYRVQVPHFSRWIWGISD